MRLPAALLIALLLVPVAGAQIPVPTPSPRAAAFHDELFHLWLLHQGALFALMGWLVLSGAGAKVAKRCVAIGRGRIWFGALLFAAFVGALYALTELTVDLIRTQRLAPHAGREPPAIPGWLAGEAGSTLALIVALALTGSGLNWLIRRSPRWWWAWLSAGVTAVMSTYLLLQPLIDAEQRTYPRIEHTTYANWAPRIAALIARTGAHDVPVLVRPTREGDFCRTSNSAIGLGPTRAIVMADQIFTEWEPRMVDVAVAHEMKHYLFDNTWLPIVLAAVLSTAGAFSVHLAAMALTRRLSRRTRITSVNEPAALPLLAGLLQIYLLAAVPAFNLTSQTVELAADRFALDLTGDARARGLVSARPCGSLWLAEDRIFERLYLNTHPSIAKRVRLANEYQLAGSRVEDSKGKQP